MIEDNTSTDMEVPVMLSSVLGGLLRNQRPCQIISIHLSADVSCTLGHARPTDIRAFRRVGTYSALIARELGLSEKDQSTIKLAGLLHDIGKIGVEKAPLYKPDKLSDEEMHEMKRHVILGYEIIVEVPSSGRYCLLGPAPSRADGWQWLSPRTFRDEIPLGSRILCVADSFDAMVTSRIYRPTVSVPKALEELERCSGTQFDIE